MPVSALTSPSVMHGVYGGLRRINAPRRMMGRLPVPTVRTWYRARTRLLHGYSDADPCRLLWVDPRSIRSTEGPGGQCRIGVVMDGDWDRTAMPLDEDARNADIQHLYEGGLSSGIRQEVPHRLLPKMVEKLDRIFESILRHGYLPQTALLQLDRAATERLNNDVVHPVFNEIGVNVYRDGRLVRTGGGFHRLALAAALGVPSVPVIVRVRHARWQAIRREIAGARCPDTLNPTALAHLDHPDLTDLLPSAWMSSHSAQR